MYNLNIIGNGRVTLSLLKSIIDQRLDRYFRKITIWYREQKGLFFNNATDKDKNINEEIIRIYLMNKIADNELNKVEEKIIFRSFNTLDDLMQVNTDNSNNLLILTVKYNLDELVYIDKKKRERINPSYPRHFEILLSRMKVVIPGIGSEDEQKGSDFHKKVLGLLKQISDERRLVNMAINRLSSQIIAGYERLYNLEHSAIGIKYLSQVLRNYNGIIFNIINEIDTTNYILYKFSGLEPEKVISPCENDTIRARYFLKTNLKLKGFKATEISLSYIGPHNYSGFIPPETITVDSKQLTKLLDSQTAMALVDEVTKKVNGFGEDVFLQKGSSDEDTVIGICSALTSLLKDSKSIVRVSCYNKEDQLFYGLPGFFKGGQFITKNIVSELSPKSREKLLKANNEQKLINSHIMSAIHHDQKNPQDIMRS